MHPAPLKPLLQAIRANDLTTVRSLAAAFPSLLTSHNPDSFGATPLITAVGVGDRGMVDLLLELGADIDQKSEWWAGGFGVLDSADPDMAAYLLTRGAKLTPHAAARLGMIGALRAMLTADPTLVHARGGDGQMPLHFASTPEIAALLLDHGASIDAKDIDHASTPAEYLATSHPKAAAYLLTRGAHPDPFLAALTSDLALLERLLSTEPEGVRIRVTRERFPAPPPAAGHIYLYTIGTNCTLLHAAASAGRPEVITWLAAHDADPNARGGYDDSTPLHAAAWSNQAEAASALLDAGADINRLSGHMHRNQPIGWAIVSGAADAVRLLCDRGATITAMHREDAARGPAGAFRDLNRRRPLEAWSRIAGILNVQK